MLPEHDFLSFWTIDDITLVMTLQVEYLQTKAFALSKCTRGSSVSSSTSVWETTIFTLKLIMELFFLLIYWIYSRWSTTASSLQMLSYDNCLRVHSQISKLFDFWECSRTPLVPHEDIVTGCRSTWSTAGTFCPCLHTSLLLAAKSQQIHASGSPPWSPIQTGTSSGILLYCPQQTKNCCLIQLNLYNFFVGLYNPPNSKTPYSSVII